MGRRGLCTLLLHLLGMHGGGALGNCYAPGGCWNVAVFDQSNAFTSLRSPQWFWRWSASPPVRAADVWDLLPARIRADAKPMDWISPCYTRLAMGSAHSVHLLMSANFEVVGRALWQSRRLSFGPAQKNFSRVELEVVRR